MFKYLPVWLSAILAEIKVSKTATKETSAAPTKRLTIFN